ncbi:hypothetical protein, partial [Phytoactinopolyspora endophytica]|uniref:hypothetical protein n=1 Tax=Phytoactinopolyspora endophytica TaxID=1642495 RepID=UPI0013EC3858
GGLASPPEWARTYSEQEGGFFGWGDVSPEAVAAAIEATPDALDMPDAEVDNAFVVRSSWAEGNIVINVVVTEGDRSSSARWDATGSTVLSTY